jgi:type IV pilus biogenesis protein PilP
MFNRKKMIVLSLASCFISQAVFAAGTAEELERISNSTALLTAQKKELDLKLQVAAAQAEVDRLGGNAKSGANEDQSVIPVVRGIEGIDGKLFATLSYGNGMQQTAKQGETIYGGWTISQISVNTVTLVGTGGKKIRLVFGNEPSAGRTATAGQPAGQPFGQSAPANFQYPAPGAPGR